MIVNSRRARGRRDRRPCRHRLIRRIVRRHFIVHRRVKRSGRQRARGRVKLRHVTNDGVGVLRTTFTVRRHHGTPVDRSPRRRRRRCRTHLARHIRLTTSNLNRRVTTGLYSSDMG